MYLRKRIVASILSLSLLTTTAAHVAFAADKTYYGSNESNLSLHSGVENFSNSFNVNAVPNARSIADDNEAPTVGSAEYSYTVKMGNDGNGSANLSFDLSVDENVSHIDTTGSVYQIDLDDTYTVIKGTLEGTTNINDVDYEVSVGFNQLSGEDDIGAGIVLTPSDFDTNENARQILLSLGTPITETEARDAYLDYMTTEGTSEGNTDVDEGIAPQSAVYYTAVTGTLRTDGAGAGYNGSGTGSSMAIYRDTSNKRITLAIQSFTGNIKNSDFQYDTLIATGINAVQLDLYRVGSNTHISALEGIDTTSKKYSSNLNSTLFNVFVAVLGDIGVPTNTLQTILSGVGGYVTALHDGAHSYLRADIENVNVNFDNYNKRFPAGFDITTNGLTGTYTAKGNLTYLVETYTAAFPIRTTTATKQLTIS